MLFYTIILWAVGHTLNETSKSIFAKVNIFFITILKIFSSIIPDLEKVNLKDLLIYEQTVSFDYILKTQLSFTFYSIALLFIISYVFNNKNLD